MFSANQPEPDQVDCLLRNAELRDQLEPLLDESIGSVDVGRMTTRSENDFLESMLAWERAPMVPVADWFDPPLVLPDAETLSDASLREHLMATVEALHAKKIVLEFTDHLTDRELYRLVARDILPSYEKKLENRTSFLHWDCADTSGDPDTWLTYYATQDERELWSEETGQAPPPRALPPYARRLPEAPM